ncbi:MPPV-161 hypothetical protein [Magpiepox virus 2]|nr:MPPV-161 hypothetical protein [Magpiepox virus 2]
MMVAITDRFRIYFILRIINSEVNKFCLSYDIYPTTPVPYITE